MVYRKQGVPGMRQIEFKALKNRTIMVRVVGKGKLFTWSRWGTLAPNQTMDEWAAEHELAVFAS